MYFKVLSRGGHETNGEMAELSGRDTTGNTFLEALSIRTKIPSQLEALKSGWPDGQGPI